MLWIITPDTAPRNQYFLISSHELDCDTSLDLIWRYMDQSGNGATTAPSYLEMDVRLAYRPYDDVELSLVGRNLLDSSHKELQSISFPSTEVRREVYGMISLQY